MSTKISKELNWDLPSLKKKWILIVMALLLVMESFGLIMIKFQVF